MARKVITGKERVCFRCGGEPQKPENFWKSRSSIYQYNDQRMPVCRDCICELYDEYLDKYEKYYDSLKVKPFIEQEFYFERQAIKRLCMMFDAYYDDKVFDGAAKQFKGKEIANAYFRSINLRQHMRKSFDDTVFEDTENARVIPAPETYKTSDITKKTKKFFGAGFTDDEYYFLQKEYDDWISRHECETKAQEEVFKDICYNRLLNIKALREGKNTKDITMAFQHLLDTGNLKPKQNHRDTLAKSHTGATLMQKWEAEQPAPDIDENLKDVDNLGLMVDVFFKGHTAKACNVPNAESKLYHDYMEKYTVRKPEYKEFEDDEVLFDAVFGEMANDDVGEFGGSDSYG